jgi:hypothetical protein
MISLTDELIDDRKRPPQFISHQFISPLGEGRACNTGQSATPKRRKAKTSLYRRENKLIMYEMRRLLFKRGVEIKKVRR